MRKLVFRLSGHARYALVAVAAALLALVALGGNSADATFMNRGFETGNLSGWTTGSLTSEGITVVGTDTINAQDGVYQAPLEGKYMARLGKPAPDKWAEQPMGLNELIQQFVVDEPFVKFAYSMWTYDYTGFDEFSIELKLAGSANVIYSYRQQAWGAPHDTARKSTGWQVVSIPVQQYEGQSVTLTIRAGGSIDTWYHSWVYIDSAESVTPPQVVDFSSIRVNGFQTSRDPASQTINVRRPPGTGSFRLDLRVVCPDGSAPTSVSLIVGTPSPTIVPLARDGDDIWGADIPTPQGTAGQSFPLTLVVVCPGQTITVLIGSVTLVDPSGYITDAQTTLPIPEATVTLQRLDGCCWVTVNPYEIIDNNPTIKPQVNPQLTDDTGHYGWDVMAGTYRVIVSMSDYVTQTSQEVTVPPPVTDLNVALQPSLGPPVSGDVDCSGAVDSVDALKILRYVAGLPVAQNPGCPGIGEGEPSVVGDVDCGGGVDSLDALKVLRHIAGLPNNLPPGCPEIET